ncbi:hypothetical protein [Chryseobacterium sp. RLHN22]
MGSKEDGRWKFLILKLLGVENLLSAVSFALRSSLQKGCLCNQG